MTVKSAQKHFYDSVVPFLHTSFQTLCDVGSGAGFPGIPLAIAWPNRSFVLVEPLAKRCRFLNEVKNQLHLDNVRNRQRAGRRLCEGASRTV